MRRKREDIAQLDNDLLDFPDPVPSPEAGHLFGEVGSFDFEGLCPCVPSLYEVEPSPMYAALLRFAGHLSLKPTWVYQHRPYIEVSHRKSHARSHS